MAKSLRRNVSTKVLAGDQACDIPDRNIGAVEKNPPTYGDRHSKKEEAVKGTLPFNAFFF